MKPLYDATTVMLTLRDGINKGYWTLEDLDVPPPGYIGTPENFRNLVLRLLGVDMDTPAVGQLLGKFRWSNLCFGFRTS